MRRPVRVLELRTVRGTGGGPEKTILLGAQQSDPAQFVVTVCYLRSADDPQFLIDQRARDLGVDYCEIRERHPFSPAILRALRRIIDERRIDIVHAHEYKSDVLAWLLSRRAIPLATAHGWFGSDTRRERLYYAVDKRLLASFPRVVAVSDEIKRELVRTGSRPDRITVIPNGIDHRRFAREPAMRAEMRRSLGIAADDLVIGAVGRLERQKRFDLAMEVVVALRTPYPRIRLFIAGEGGLRAELERTRDRLELGDACVLLGHRMDVPALHHAFDVFLQASDEEGSPNVVLEAMALETPIVATNVGGAADIVTHEEHGLLVPPGDASALAAAVRRVLTDWPAARARAAAARRRVETELSFEARMRRVEAIYEELALARSATV
jgi:glycosyltransferase involved in cell wall biosynthesis